MRDRIFHLFRVSVAGCQGPGISSSTNLLSHDGRTLLFELYMRVGYKLPSLLPNFITSPSIFCSFWMNMFLDPVQLFGELGMTTLTKLSYPGLLHLGCHQIAISCLLWPMTYFSDCCWENSLVFGKKIIIYFYLTPNRTCNSKYNFFNHKYIKRKVLLQ